MTSAIQIGRHFIGRDHPPFIIAEMSGNHNGSLKRALQIVDAAAKAGAHALKIQTYTADTMTLNIAKREFVIRDKRSLWNGRSLYELYQEASTPWAWHKPIFDRCRELGLIGFSTPFDATAVDFLEKLRVPLYKIASFENIDLPLIRRVAETGKPVIISTGMATRSELAEAVHAARSAGCRDLILLKCTSAYPAPPEEANLATLQALRAFKCYVGISDHTLGLSVSIASVALGAVAIERHMTLRRKDGGVDAAFSLEPREMTALVHETGLVHQAIGNVRFGPSEREKASLKFRRSLYIVKDVNASDILTAENVRAIRPGLGLPPKHYNKVLGTRLIKAARKGTPLSWDLIRHG